MRPASHREQQFEKRCGNCKHAFCPMYKDDLLCFLGDDIKVATYVGGYTAVYFKGEDVGLLDGEEYSDVWGGRAVDADLEVCDQWEASQ